MLSIHWFQKLNREVLELWALIPLECSEEILYMKEEILPQTTKSYNVINEIQVGSKN